MTSTPGATGAGGGAPQLLDDACSLATNEEISSASGATIAQAVASPSSCTWNDGSGALVANVTWIGGDAGEATWQGMQNEAMGGVEVSGIGDEALWINNTTSLAVRKGEGVLNIGVALTLGDEPARRDIAEKIGRIVAPRAP